MDVKLLNSAIQAVRAASFVCQSVQRDLVREDTMQKKDRSPVTVADFASQAIISEHLRAAGAEGPIVGEENADELRKAEQSQILQAVQRHVQSVYADVDTDTVLNWIDRAHWKPDGSKSRYWTLDPIDGTKGFLRGEQYAVALALIENGEVVLGVLGCPNLEDATGRPGVILAAGKDMGSRQLSLDSSDTWEQASAVHVSEVTDPKLARFCESVESGHTSHDDAARTARKLGISTEPVRLDSQAKYATVARGQASIYMRLSMGEGYREKIWDHAAGMIVVREAGGKVTDTTGKPLDFSCGEALLNNIGVIATNKNIHDAVIDALQSVSAK